MYKRYLESLCCQRLGGAIAVTEKDFMWLLEKIKRRMRSQRHMQMHKYEGLTLVLAWGGSQAWDRRQRERTQARFPKSTSLEAGRTLRGSKRDHMHEQPGHRNVG